MHECPQCWSICYCDLDDSNDCRDHGRCYHECQPKAEDDKLYDDGLDEDEQDAAPARSGEEGTETCEQYCPPEITTPCYVRYPGKPDCWCAPCGRRAPPVTREGGDGT